MDKNTRGFGKILISLASEIWNFGLYGTKLKL